MFLSLAPILLGDLTPPRLVELVIDSGTCFLKCERELGIVSQPEKSLRPGNLTPELVVFGAVDQLIKLVRLKWPSGVIHEG